VVETRAAEPKNSAVHNKKQTKKKKRKAKHDKEQHKHNKRQQHDDSPQVSVLFDEIKLSMVQIVVNNFGRFKKIRVYTLEEKMLQKL